MQTTTTPPADARHLVPDRDETLVTGWEASVQPTDSVLRNYVATLEDRLRLLAADGRGRVERSEHALMVDLDSAYVFDNIVVTRGFLDDVRLAEVVVAAKDFFPSDRAWSFQALSPAAALAPHGLTLLGHPPLMYRPAGGEGPQRPAGLEIRRVVTRSELNDFERILVSAYPLPAGSAVVDPRVLGSRFEAWVGYVDDRPVATSGSHSAHGLTEVEWVSTLPEYRGRGIGAAMTWAATVASPTQPVALVATDDGRPVYEALGFIALLRLAMWLKP